MPSTPTVSMCPQNISERPDDALPARRSRSAVPPRLPDLDREANPAHVFGNHRRDRPFASRAGTSEGLTESMDTRCRRSEMDGSMPVGQTVSSPDDAREPRRRDHRRFVRHRPGLRRTSRPRRRRGRPWRAAHRSTRARRRTDPRRRWPRRSGHRRRHRRGGVARFVGARGRGVRLARHHDLQCRVRLSTERSKKRRPTSCGG